jgi:ABC-2 type transport system ATP-binding protein
MAAPLALTQVCKAFNGRRVLDGLDLQVEPGEVVALLGRNGAGKTTTLNLVLGFEQADSGTVAICGDEPQKARTHLAYLPEQVALYPHLSGLENLRYFTALAGLKLSKPEAAALLAEAGLPPEACQRRASAYSKGMRQKVGLAIALARRCPLLLLDEPGSGLDPLAMEELGALVRRVAARGTGVLVVSHDLFGLKPMADRAVVLEDGKIGHSFDPRHADAAALLSFYGATS